MAAVRLPPPTDRSLSLFLETINGDPPEESIRLGGGTALAALWNHRHSTDIDLVCERSVFMGSFPKERRAILVRQLQHRRDTGGERISAIRATRNMIGWRTASGPVSLVSSRLSDFPRLWSDSTVEGTRVRLATVEAILHGKLFGRLVGGQHHADRDGYDFAVALLLERERMEWLLNDEDGDEVLAEARRGRGRKDGRKPILDAAFPRIADDPWGEACRIFDHDLTLADYERVPVSVRRSEDQDR